MPPGSLVTAFMPACTAASASSENRQALELRPLLHVVPDDAHDARHDRVAARDARGQRAELDRRHQHIALADAGVERFALLPGHADRSRPSRRGRGSRRPSRREFRMPV